MSILVTGAAGFIGFHTVQALLEKGETVVGVDNLVPYYDVQLKKDRLTVLSHYKNFTNVQADISDRAAMVKLFADFPQIDAIVNLAAQAGVRHSLENPYIYVDTNIMGQVVLLEEARKLKNLRHFVYASSSSVYGGNTEMPFSIAHRVDRPLAVYAASKKAGEMMAYSYSHLYNLPTTGLRFFSVYGPWGRPDMAAWLFVEAILTGQPIKVFNHGQMRRDFTYIDDIVQGVLAALERPPVRQGKEPPFRIYNLGNNRSEDLMGFISIVEKRLGKVAVKDMLPMQPGDVPESFADITESQRDLGYKPMISINTGLVQFIDWYLEYKSGKLRAAA